jgi:hypothetical protein
VEGQMAVRFNTKKLSAHGDTMQSHEEFRSGLTARDRHWNC